MHRLLFFTLLAFILLAGCAKKPVADGAASLPAPASPAAAEIRQDPLPGESLKETAAAAATDPSATEGLTRIYFDFDSFVLSTQARRALEENAGWLRRNPEARITIEGHTDERGSDAYNLSLGERRARAAMDYLVGLGIRPERIAILSYGEERPAVTGAGETAWAQNRRDEFVTRN